MMRMIAEPGSRKDSGGGPGQKACLWTLELGELYVFD